MASYSFQSPWAIVEYESRDSYYGGFSEEKHEYDVSDEPLEHVEKALSFFDNEFASSKSVLDEIATELLGTKSDVVMSLVDSGFMVTELNTEADLTDEQLDTFVDWLEGQCSDGFGESLEQCEFLSNTEREEEYASDYVNFDEWVDDAFGDDVDRDDPDLQYDYEDAQTETTVNTDYYINIWPDNFSVKAM